MSAITVLGLVSVGCAGAPLVLPVRMETGPLTAPVRGDSLAAYEAAVRSILAVMVTELGLSLPREFTVFVYPTRRAYAGGLVQIGQMPDRRASEIARYSVGLGQNRRLFINDAALRDVPRSAWLGVLAHELTHVAQYELSGGRRGRSEQWLREGMADWVACQVLERLGERTFRRERDEALHAVAQDLALLGDDPLDLVDLGRPQGWEARHLRSGDRLTYRLAFLLTDELIHQRGFEKVLAYFRAFADSDDRFWNFQRTFGLSLQVFEGEALERIRREVGARSPSTKRRRAAG